MVKGYPPPSRLRDYCEEFHKTCREDAAVCDIAFCCKLLPSLAPECTQTVCICTGSIPWMQQHQDFYSVLVCRHYSVAGTKMSCWSKCGKIMLTSSIFFTCTVHLLGTEPLHQDRDWFLEIRRSHLISWAVVSAEEPSSLNLWEKPAWASAHQQCLHLWSVQ